MQFNSRMHSDINYKKHKIIYLILDFKKISLTITDIKIVKIKIIEIYYILYKNYSINCSSRLCPFAKK